jgi:hypothetical protein
MPVSGGMRTFSSNRMSKTAKAAKTAIIWSQPCLVTGCRAVIDAAIGRQPTPRGECMNGTPVLAEQCLANQGRQDRQPKPAVGRLESAAIIPPSEYPRVREYTHPGLYCDAFAGLKLI